MGEIQRTEVLDKECAPTLNIDRLVRGFMDGIDLFKQEAMKDTDLRANFVSHLTK